MTKVQKGASGAKVEDAFDPTLLLAILAVLLLVMGTVAIVLLLRSKKTGSDTPDEGVDRQDALLQMLLASKEPALREYLQHTPDPANPTDADSATTIQRIAQIFLPKPETEPVPPTLSDVVLALALLESRLTSLTTTAVRIETQSVTKDRMVWAVLGVLGALVSIIGGVVALAALTARLIGAD